MSNQLSETYESLVNIDENRKIIEAMITKTNEDGEISELAVAAEAQSNVCDVFKGSFNHLKILHAKKSLICNYVKGATAPEDTIIYDVIVKYNTTNSTTSPTVLCTIDVSSFVSRTFADEAARATASSGVLPNSTNLAVDFSKLAALKDMTAYLDVHNEFHDSIKESLLATKAFT